jgi:type IV secretory pathway TraG/TraD family ATPase VirD4
MNKGLIVLQRAGTLASLLAWTKFCTSAMMSQGSTLALTHETILIVIVFVQFFIIWWRVHTAMVINDHKLGQYIAVLGGWLVVSYFCFSASAFMGYFSFLFPVFLLSTVSRVKETVDIDGRRESDYLTEAKRLNKIAQKSNDPFLYFGGMWHPLSVAMLNFLTIGSIGSGKTITLLLLMQSIFPKIGQGTGLKAIIYDYKREMLSQLSGMGVTARTIILNPLDKRAYAINLGKDVVTPTEATSLASSLIQREEKDDPFFVQSSQALVGAVIEILQERAGEYWTLRDVYLAVSNRNVLRSLLEAHPEHAEHLETLSADKQASGVMATINSKMTLFKPIAALWDYAEQQGRSISLTDWVETDGTILVMSNDARFTPTLSKLNQFIFNRSAELLLSQSNSSTLRTIFVMDELPTAGKLDKLQDLATLGRSRGVSIWAGFQSIEGMRHVYGEKPAHVICEQFHHKALLRCGDAPTAKFCSETIGEVEQRVTTQNTSRNHGREGVSTSVSTNTNIRRVAKVMPSEFLSIPAVHFGDATKRSQDMEGYYLGDTFYGLSYTIQHLKQNLPAETPNVENFIPAPASAQRLRPWDQEDLYRLDIAGIVQASIGTTGTPLLMPTPVENDLSVLWEEIRAEEEQA